MDMDSDDFFAWVIIIALLVVVTLFGVAMVGSRIKSAAPHEQVYYVIGYTKSWYTGISFTKVPITKVIGSYQVLQVGSEEGQGLIVETETRYYGGHYDFELGKLYKIHSEGNYWWLYRKITQAELLGDN